MVTQLGETVTLLFQCFLCAAAFVIVLDIARSSQLVYVFHIKFWWSMWGTTATCISPFFV